MWLWEMINERPAAAAAAQLHAAGGTAPATGAGVTVRLAELARTSALGAQLEPLRGRLVLIAVHRALTAALACIELDGVARRIMLCPPELDPVHLPAVIRDGEADACVHDVGQIPINDSRIAIHVAMQPALQHGAVPRRCSHETEWVLLTSGTSGAPKLVVHTLASLWHAFVQQPRPPEAIVWSTFYDIRRYGGLQILLRALHDGALVLGNPEEPVPEFLARAAAHGVTHISGTASHWRRVLMSGAAGRIAPRYVRLSGEIADQGILDALQAAYPAAQVAHAYASTEAGVGFEVGDGLAGFPAQLAARPHDGVEIRIAGEGVASGPVPAGTLQIRSGGTALRYLGQDAPALREADGFVDNGDQVQLREGRYYFVGRNGGIINVGGLKVHPEEIEAVINAHPWVRMSRVQGRRSPITGAVVTAEVVLVEPVLVDPSGRERPPEADLTAQILDACRRSLPAHKVPALLRVVPALPLSANGKLVRANA